MKLTNEEWEKVKFWLEGYRVCCVKNSKNAPHPKISESHQKINFEIREWLHKKESTVIQKPRIMKVFPSIFLIMLNYSKRRYRK